MAHTERNFNILSDGDNQERSSQHQNIIGLSESQRDFKFNAGLFSPLSMNKSNSNKVTENSRPSALTNSDK
jgi:hypothetical protein